MSAEHPGDEEVVINNTELYALLTDEAQTNIPSGTGPPTVLAQAVTSIEEMPLDQALNLFILNEDSEGLCNLAELEAAGHFMVSIPTIIPLPEDARVIENVSSVEIGLQYYRDFLAEIKRKHDVETGGILQLKKLRRIRSILVSETISYIEAISASDTLTDDAKSTIIDEILLDYGIVYSNYCQPDKSVSVSTKSRINKGILHGLLRIKGSFPERHARFEELENYIACTHGSEVYFSKLLFGIFSELYFFQVLTHFGEPKISGEIGDVRLGYDISLYLNGNIFYFDIKCGSEYDFTKIELHTISEKPRTLHPSLLHDEDEKIYSKYKVVVRVSAKLLSLLTLNSADVNDNQGDIHMRIKYRLKQLLFI